MRNYKTLLLLIVCGCTLFATSCKKNEYLTDDGVHAAKTPLNTYDYLRANQAKLFDTMILVIDKFGLQEELMSAKTVFAVTDFSFRRYMTLKTAELRQVDETRAYTLDSLYKYMTADSIRQYFFNEKITLDAAVIEPEVKTMTSNGKTSAGFSKRIWTILELNNNDGGLANWTQTPAYGLYYTRVRGAVDVPGITPPANEVDIKVLCQTTGILTSSAKDPGYDQVLHVLSNTHVFSLF